MIRLVGDSAESDAALIALADAVKVTSKLKAWLLVGGHMVNLHTLRSGLDLPPRPTHDSDVAVNLMGFRMRWFISRLRRLGYDNLTYSNRFERTVNGSTASIDIVIPSFSTKHQPNINVGVIGIDGMPFVDIALQRPPVVVAVETQLSDGTRRELKVRIPDVVTAIAIKSFAVAERSNQKDAHDIAQLLQIVRAEGIERNPWSDGAAFAAAARQLHAQFDTPGGVLADATSDTDLQKQLRETTRDLLRGHTRTATSVF